MNKELLTRYANNPILTALDVPFLCNAVYNPGAVKFGNRYIMIPRVEDGRRDNRLHVAESGDGIHFTIRPEPIMLPLDSEAQIWEKHMYDPRVTFLEGVYYIAYCAQTMEETVRIGLMKTVDFESFERVGLITPPWNRNCALFPERIGGLYARFERPMNGADAVNFISYSPDLLHWGQAKAVELKTETWLRNKWGVGPSPIKTDEGWLVIFHGVWWAIGPVYRLGVMLLDLEQPHKVIGQCPEFILTPREPYERIGEVNNCVFSNGAIVEPDGQLKVYYGAADTCICLATGNLVELIAACKQ